MSGVSDNGRNWRYRRLAILVAAAVVLADQASKAAVLYAAFSPPAGAPAVPASWPFQHVELLPVLDLQIVWNYGFSFGTLNGAQLPYQALLLALLSLAIAGGMVLWLRRAASALLAVGLAGIIGGAIGNVVDRVRFGAVVDFIGVHWGNRWFPSFNIADSAITVGVVLILIENLVLEPRRARGAATDATRP